LTDSSTQPYIIRARKWGYGKITTLPRDLAEIPTDLLAPTEREWNSDSLTPLPVWVRTTYGAGTDARFQELLYGLGMRPDDFGGHVANDAERYDLADEQALYAFFPSLLEVRGGSYEDEDLSDDDPELQNVLYMTDHKNTIPEDDRLTSNQQYVFVADFRAFRSGFVEWRMVDEFGNALFRERIQPWSLRDVIATRIYRSPQEFREAVARGYYGGDSRYSDSVVGTWEPPTEENGCAIAYDV
jgi:hypothetical protein